MNLIWLRTDLRLHDNTALAAAAQRGPTVAVYLISPEQWLAHDDAPCKVDFWLRNLETLSHSLGELNIPLLIRHAETWDQAPKVLATLCKELSIESVHVNDEYGIHESRRDAAVAKALEDQGVTFHHYLDQLLFEPGSVLTKTGTYFQVFSQFRKVCYSRLHSALPRLVATPKAQASLKLKSDSIPGQVNGFATPSDSLRALWPAGEAEARRRLEQFADGQISYYKDERDFPAKPGTSQLSAYLAAGVVSPRQCLHAALQSNQGEFESGDIGAITWINELLWREFYKHILVGYPRVSRHRAFRPETEAVAWRNAPEDLAAWQEARTGLPIIDAAMRQLLETGWMHNRLRMVVAMFLTKNLLIDWREGERFFMRHLIDGDLAANNGGWQWSSSTGTDSAPYFRIFSPLSQSEKFDGEGVFIKHWLPQLSALNKKEVHNPDAVGGLFGVADYPRPIVDLKNPVTAPWPLSAACLRAKQREVVMSDFLRRFAHSFASLDKHNLHLLDSLYSKDIAFADPLHEVQGLTALHAYFAELYSNVSQLRFDFHGFDQVAEGEGYLRWKMSFCHPRLANGKVIRVEGCSHLMWRDKVYRHRDYFDAGAMLYEHLPVLGSVVGWLKRRMA